jgi:hypothetical protein
MFGERESYPLDLVLRQWLKTQADLRRPLEKPLLRNMCLYRENEEKVVKDCLSL